jgi:hypothetical protein
LKDIKTKVENLFPLKNWTEFIHLNFKQYNRYIRDQALDALKYFDGKEIDTVILDKALEFCIQSSTLSISNLNDTYRCYLEAYEESKDMFPPEYYEPDKSTNNKQEQPDVKRRNFEVYKSILKNKKVG